MASHNRYSFFYTCFCIPGESYNVGTGVTTAFNDIVNIIGRVLGREIHPKYVQNPFRNYQLFTLANTVKTRRDLNWNSKTSIKEGVAIMASHLGIH